MQIDPKSIAGILLREFGTYASARDYARRMAQRCEATGASVMAADYATAAADLQRVLAQQSDLNATATPTARG